MRFMKIRPRLISIWTICFYFGIEVAAFAATNRAQSEVSKEISKTHNIWGSYIDYAVILAMLFGIISIILSCYMCQRGGKNTDQAKHSNHQEAVQESYYQNISTGYSDNTRLKKDIRSLEDQINSLKAELKTLRGEIKRGENVHRAFEKETTNFNSESAYPLKLQSKEPYDVSLADNFISEYNALYDMQEGPDKAGKQIDLEGNTLVKRFGCSNAHERLKNPDVKPIFANDADGLYLAYSLGNNYYAVLPTYKTYENTRHVMYALGEVFDSNYEGGAYKKIKVERPAIFVVSDDIWNLKEKGKLVLNK